MLKWVYFKVKQSAWVGLYNKGSVALRINLSNFVIYSVDFFFVPILKNYDVNSTHTE